MQIHQQPNPNYQQDLLSEASQLAHLAVLPELLDNVWFKHFVAVWMKERERARMAVVELPVTIPTLPNLLQTRGEAAAYDEVINLPYQTYKDLIERKQEYEREHSS